MIRKYSVDPNAYVITIRTKFLIWEDTSSKSKKLKKEREKDKEKERLYRGKSLNLKKFEIGKRNKKEVGYYKNS